MLTYIIIEVIYGSAILIPSGCKKTLENPNRKESYKNQTLSKTKMDTRF